MDQKYRSLSDAFIVALSFIGDSSVSLIFGNTAFYSQSLLSLTPCGTKIKRATIFLCPLADLDRYGFLAFDAQGKVNGIEEKPKNRNSNFPIAPKESQTYEQRKINSPVFSRLASQKRQAFNLLSCLRKAFFFLRWQRVYLFGNRNI